MSTTSKADLLQKRRWRIRKKVFGTAVRPRLAVRFTSKLPAPDDTVRGAQVFLRAR